MKVCPECGQEFEEGEFCPADAARLRDKQAQEDGETDRLVGRLLDGRWRIDEKFGEGGMGSIYRASQKSVQREVAIKTLRATLSNNEEFTERFLQEARVTSTIHHPHCVTIHDFGQTDDGTLYLVMEM
ncbi:MAG: protein kinase, partial [Bradymonadaceae bacterium]